MKSTLGAVVVLLALVSGAQAELQFEQLQAVHGELGPKRASLDFDPGDELVFRYALTGCTVTEGQIGAALTMKVTDPDGNVALDQTTKVNGTLALGGLSFPGTVKVSFGTETKPGPYELTVTVRDDASKQEASFQRTLVCKKPAFAIVRPRFSYDAEGKAPATAGGVVGQALYFRCKAVGFDTSSDRIHVRMEGQVLDEKGKEMLPKPVTAEIDTKSKLEAALVTTVNFSSDMVLNRAGNFRFRVTIIDELGRQQARFECPLRVAESAP